jgi:glycosyltransferase involved in cell wall biosynthesis
VTKPRVLILCPYFLPGEQGGGSVRAVVNLIEHLRADFDFVVSAGAHDLNSQQPYTVQQQQQTRATTGLDIRYLPRGLPLWGVLRSLLAEPWDLIYFNSFLSPRYTALPLLLRRFGRRREVPALLAPRGELMQGSMQHRWLRKRGYLFLLRTAGLLDGLVFHATSQAEAAEMAVLGLRPVLLAADLPPRPANELVRLQSPPPGPLRLAFVARLDPNKNLGFALRTLALVRVPLLFDIIGPVGRAEYWRHCQQLIAALPSHVQVRYLGAMPHDQVMSALGRCEMLFFPSQAENNGYVILEALVAGCALLISDRTPWRGLADLGVGLDLPLDHEQAFAAAIDSFARLPESLRLEQRQRAQAYGLSRLQARQEVGAMQALLQQAIAMA